MALPNGMGGLSAVDPSGQSVVPPPSPDIQTQSPSVNASVQTPDQPTQQMAPPQVSPQMAHHAAVGGAWKALGNLLEGKSTSYQQTPNGPVPVETQNKPGQFFRNILAGALLGAGSGGDNAGSGWTAAGRGAAAAQQGQQQAQQRAQQQSQQQFQNQLTANKEKREQQAFTTEEQVRKAQLAMSNMELLRNQLLLQGTSWDLHNKMAEDDKSRSSSFSDAGVKPIYENIPENEMETYIKNNPGAGNLKWFHTGVDTVTMKDRDGKEVPNYVSTFSAYDPKSEVPLSAETVKQWKDDGLFKYHPEYQDILKPGKTLNVAQFTSTNQTARNLANQDFAKNKDNLELDHLKAQIGEAKAAVKAHMATTAEAGLNISEKKQALADKKSTDDAWDALSKVGNDPDKLTDAHQRTLIARSVQPLMTETLNGIKAAAAEGDQAEQAQLWGKYNAYQKLASLAPPGSSSSPISVSYNGQVGTFDSQEKADAFMNAHQGATLVGGKPTDPLVSLSNDLALIKDSKGNTTPVAKNVVDGFLKTHPEFKLVGYGQKQSQAPDLTEPNFSQK